MAAQIPRYQRRVAPDVASAPRAIGSSPDLSGAAQSLSRFANDLDRIQQQEVEDTNRTAFINADTQLGQWQNKALFDPEAGAFTKKGSGALGLTQSTLAEYDKQQTAILESLTNERQRQMFQQSAIARRGQLESKLGNYEFGEQQAFKDDSDKASIQLSMDSAALDYRDQQSVEQNRLKMNAVLDQRAERLGWSSEQKQAEFQKYNSSLSQAVIQRTVIDSPQQAKSLFEQYKGGMTADDQIRTTSTIDQAFRRQEAEARQRQVEARQLQAIQRVELSSRVQDASSAALQGFQYDNPPTLADFRASYPPEKAQKEYEQFAKVQAVAPAIREFATATPEERQDILSRFQPAANGVAGEGFKEDSQIYQHLSSVATGLMRQQQQDPAAYVAKYSPTVQQAFAAAQEAGTPEAYDAYVNATVAEQKRLGVQQPKLLPDASADALAASINGKIASGSTENAAQLVEGLQAVWGKNFGSIVQQVGNKLPEEVQVLATGLPKDVAERMASVAPLKDSDLKSGLQKGQADEISQAVSAALQPFSESLQGQSGGINTYSTISKAANRTAISYVLQGMSANAAAEKVAKAIVNDKYDFFGTYRVPKAVDTDAVSTGAERALESIKPEELQPLAGIRGVAPGENIRQLHEAIISGGQWVNTNDESGLALTLNGYRVLGKDGKPIVRSWAELQQKANETRKRQGAPVLGIYN